MGFLKDEFALTSELFEEWLVLEKNAMLISLAGDENLNSGARGSASFSHYFYQNIKWSLRDTLVAGYISSLENQVDLHPLTPEFKQIGDLLIQIALIVTSSIIA